MGGACVDLEVLWKDNKGYVLYWTVVCYHSYAVLRCMKIQSNIKFHFVGWEVWLMLFTTCCLQPA